ncbi:MAG: hypothetical protein J0H39_21355 [Alphaproteobacteria bacterium]|nr:hypothetical protein [Alphaproteobacteria bacterium]
MNKREAALAFRERLIGPTVEHAISTVPLYRELYAGISSPTSLASLANLPPLAKRVAHQAGVKRLSTAVGTCLIQYTSGTTGAPFVIHRSREEIDAISKFFTIVQAPCEGNLPVVLSLANIVHGSPTPVPGQSFVVAGACYDEHTATSTRMLLLSDYSLPGFESRISVVSGPLAQVIYFTQFLLETGVAPDKQGIRYLSVYGDYLSEPYLRYLQDAWKCPIVDKYSLSEIFGGGRRVNNEPAVFDVHAVPEVVTAEGTPAAEGQVGRLLLTSLFPFVQRQPFIRYETGDLFSRQADQNGDDFYVFRGRSVHSLEHPTESGSYLILGVDLMDAIDGNPLLVGESYSTAIPIRAKKVFQNTTFVGHVSDQGWGRWSTTLHLESTIPLAHQPEFRSAIEGEVRRKIVGRSPGLQRVLNNNTFRFNVSLREPLSLAALGLPLNQWTSASPAL